MWIIIVIIKKIITLENVALHVKEKSIAFSQYLVQELTIFIFYSFM